MNSLTFHKKTFIAVVFILLAGWCALYMSVSLAGDFSPVMFKAENDSKWVSSAAVELRFPAGDLYIAKPDSPEKRDQWLNAARHYRQSIRGELGTDFEQWIDMNFQGVRAWVRLDSDWAKAHGFSPGQEIVWQLEARWVSGNNELCVAFDFPTRESNAWNSWSTVRETATVPQDGQWHSLEIRVKVPDFDAGKLYAKPILGMDATHKAVKGNVQIRNVTLAIENPTSEQKNALATFRFSQSDNRGIDRSLYDEPSQHWLTGASFLAFSGASVPYVSDLAWPPWAWLSVTRLSWDWFSA